MGAKVIVQMDGKKTRLARPKQITIDNNSVVNTSARDNFHDFTFDYSYWSFGSPIGTNDDNCNQIHQPFVTQEQVYIDLGTDVIDCAFQGECNAMLAHPSSDRNLVQTRGSHACHLIGSFFT